MGFRIPVLRIPFIIAIEPEHYDIHLSQNEYRNVTDIINLYRYYQMSQTPSMKIVEICTANKVIDIKHHTIGLESYKKNEHTIDFFYIV